MTPKRIAIDAVGYSAILVVVIIYNRIERFNEAWALGVAFLALVPVGVIWRFGYRKFLAGDADDQLPS